MVTSICCQRSLFVIFFKSLKHIQRKMGRLQCLLTTSRQSCRVKCKHQGTLRSKTSPQQPFSLCWIYLNAQFSVLCHVRHKTKTLANSTMTKFFCKVTQHKAFYVMPLELMSKMANKCVGALCDRGRKNHLLQQAGGRPTSLCHMQRLEEVILSSSLCT